MPNLNNFVNQLKQRAVSRNELTDLSIHNLSLLHRRDKKALLENSPHAFACANQVREVLSDMGNTERNVSLGMPRTLSHPLTKNNVRQKATHQNVAEDPRNSAENQLKLAAAAQAALTLGTAPDCKMH